MKIVINRCYGGFNLQSGAFIEWQSRSGRLDIEYDFYIPRDDPHLVGLVEEWGSEATSGNHAKLAVVEIPDGVDWAVEEHDGFEHVAEKHQTWP